MYTFGRLLVVIGSLIIVIGFMLTIMSQFTNVPRLPGDIYIKKENFVFYFPIVSSLVISVMLTILFKFFTKR